MQSLVLFYVCVILAVLFGYLFCYLQNTKKFEKLAAIKFAEMKNLLVSYAISFHKEELLKLLDRPKFSKASTNEEIMAELQNKLWTATEEYDHNLKQGKLETKHLMAVVWSAFMCLNFSKNNKIN